MFAVASGGATRTLGSNVHVARGLIKNTTQGGIFY